jgi:hypothetical protein
MGFWESQSAMNKPPALDARKIAVALAMGVSVACSLTMLAIVPGCGGADLDVDRAALYTPESLAGEFAFRFKALNSETKATASKIKPRIGKTNIRLPISEEAAKKGKRVGTPKKKETKGPPTLEELVEEVDSKIDLIRDFSRSESCGKMTEAISKDQTLDDNERKTLTELVAKLAG